MRAYREFRLRVERGNMWPILQSTAMTTCWTDTSLRADEPPGTEGDGRYHGIHAFLPDSCSTFITRAVTPQLYRYSQCYRVLAVGAVELWGTVIEHEDGVLRAEHARLLAVRVYEPPWAFRCACGRYAVAAKAGRGLGRCWPEPSADYYVLRNRCAPRGCLTNPLEQDEAYVAETTVAELGRLLRQRYEVAELLAGEGPWGDG